LFLFLLQAVIAITKKTQVVSKGFIMIFLLVSDGIKVGGKKARGTHNRRMVYF
jgi:hypothetical protein